MKVSSWQLRSPPGKGSMAQAFMNSKIQSGKVVVFIKPTLTQMKTTPCVLTGLPEFLACASLLTIMSLVFLQGSDIVEIKYEVVQSCPTLSDPMDCSLPGSSVHGIFQARVLDWVAIAFSAF